jgi:hypothetical protein
LLPRADARSSRLTPAALLQGAATQAPSELGWTVEGEFAPTEVDERDKGTPDDWIPRHPELVRLTGAPRQLRALGAPPQMAAGGLSRRR